MNAPTFRLSLIATAAADGDEVIQEALAENNRGALQPWKDVYQAMLDERGLKLRPGIDVDELANMMAALEAGFVMRGIGIPESVKIDRENQRSSFGTAALALLLGVVERNYGGRNLTVEEAVCNLIYGRADSEPDPDQPSSRRPGEVFPDESPRRRLSIQQCLRICRPLQGARSKLTAPQELHAMAARRRGASQLRPGSADASHVSGGAVNERAGGPPPPPTSTGDAWTARRWSAGPVRRTCPAPGSDAGGEDPKRRLPNSWDQGAGGSRYRLAHPVIARLGLTRAEVAQRMNVRQERVSAIERAKVDISELRTLAAYIRALGGRLEIVADFGGERLVVG